MPQLSVENLVRSLLHGPEVHRIMLGWSFMSCRCFTVAHSLFVYLGDLFERDGLQLWA